MAIDNLDSPGIQSFIAEHVAEMHRHSPPEQAYALDFDRLKVPEITFWSARINGQLCGCGALKALGKGRGEIKSMRTAAAFVRCGVAQAVLDEITHAARQRGYSALVLETGTGAAFDAAHGFYQRNGFAPCEAFGDYESTEFNRFLAKTL
ncbi:MAG: GNAT family N-acetyltransferase [Lysobacterales bacterium]